MSLLATASPWNDSPSAGTNQNKKRVPSMNLPTAKKTVKNRSAPDADDDHADSRQSRESFQELNPAHLGGRIPGQPANIEETKLRQDANSLKINNLLNKITGFDSSESGRLADFKPPPQPTLTKTPVQANKQNMTPENPLIPALSKSFAPNASLNDMFYKPFTSASAGSSGSNYLDAYSTNNISYSANKNIELSAGGNSGPYYAKKDDRLNYIVHMLEEMQKEKTNHVTEEFVLYTMLGVFIIYIVDGFARIGTKYVR